MLGDFARGVDLTALPPGVRHGVELHFRVDAFTDAHPTVRESKNRIAPPHRRYAGVLLDVFHDHFLCRNWARYSTVERPDFIRQVYDALLKHRDTMPQRMRLTAEAMVAGDWLSSYADVQGIETVLRRMSRRLTRINDLATGGLALRASYDLLEEDFHRFFPQLIDHTRTLNLG
jgi:acyl carrier protein phosphodiesterase